MTSGQTGILRDPDDGVHWGTTIASLVVGAAFLALWFWLLPSWLGFEWIRQVRRNGGGLRLYPRCWVSP